MREIKFRIWDKTNKHWLTYDDVFIDQDGDIFEIEERTWSYESYMHQENITEKVEISQFTGLKDKNDIEIYEGDIVELVCGTTEGSFEVVWDELNAQFALKRMDTLYTDLNDYLHESNIVGNVFETND